MRARAGLLTAILATSFGAAALTGRASDVPYEPTPHAVVQRMLQLAQVAAGDVVYDLGCGDGRIVIAAVRTTGVRGVCVDIDPVRIRESRVNAARAGVTDKIRFVEGDLFEVPIADATVVTLYLWPQVNLRLRPRLLKELRPGTRVISHAHDMGDWAPEERVVVGPDGKYVLYRWTIPRRVDGTSTSTSTKLENLSSASGGRTRWSGTGGRRSRTPSPRSPGSPPPRPRRGGGTSC